MAAGSVSGATAGDVGYAAGLARAFGGALIFAFPLLMTMEMWELGFHMERYRLALFLVLGLPLLFGLTYYAGFRRADGRLDDLLDALAALAVGFAVSLAILSLFGLIDWAEPLEANVGKVALQAIPAAMGAVLARKQFAGASGDAGEDDHAASYHGELFLMAAGALFLAFNVAPTEEMVLISYTMAPVHTVALAGVSLVLLHLLVYRLGFAGQEAHEGHVRAFFEFTLPGFAVALLVSLYVLWTFGRLDGLAPMETASTMIVLGLPASLGAALARLVV